MIDNDPKLYIVATPIGNLGDLSFRALDVLKQVDKIAAEDTRTTKRLLDHFGISTKLIALHDHNEHRVARELIDEIAQGTSLALVSDAGTPLINDPGFGLLNLAIEHGITIVPVPGPSALVCALSVSGLATDRFSFLGFAPRTRSARQDWFRTLIEQRGTLIFYESCHRILACLDDCAAVFPAERKLVIARELTKCHESLYRGRIAEIGQFQQDVNLQKGELVVLVQGNDEKSAADAIPSEAIRILKILLAECTLKTAAEIAAKITGLSRKKLYAAALEMKQPER